MLIFFCQNKIIHNLFGRYKKYSSFCIRKAALGNLKASFHCAHWHFLCVTKKNGYGNRIQLPLEEIKLAFAASCVGGAARKLGVPYIEVYEQIFTAYDKDWLDFIVGNRQGKNPAQDYDYVEGGIANDRVIDTVNLYITGFYETESALQQLAFHKPNNQICILNQDLLNKYLEYDGTKEI